MCIRDRRLLDAVWPVGSIYLSASEISPETLFGGTWQRVKDRFLLAAGDVYAPGETGGEAQDVYKRQEYNQLALQLFQMGFFRADMADQALRCLELMDFKNKDQLMGSILQGQAAAMERQPVQPGSAAGAEVRPVSAMDQMRRQTQEAVRPR